jgi:hypothetical protein
MELSMPIVGSKKLESQAHALEVNAVLRTILSISYKLIFITEVDIIIFLSKKK